MSYPSRRWRSLPRVLRVLIVAVPVVFLGWIILVNVAIASGWLERIISGKHRMSTVTVKVGRAWMLWPGRLHVRDFELDVDAYRYQLHVDLPEGVAEIALLELLSRKFHTRSIIGTDATVVLQLKMQPDKVNERRLATYPQIDGFDRPIRNPELPNLPPLDKAFKIDLEGIDTSLQRFWFGELRFDMTEGRLRGDLRATPGHRFGVSGGVIDWTDATLGIADDDGLADSVHLHVELDVADYNPFATAGRSVLRNYTATVEAGGMVRDISFARMYLPPKAKSVALGGGAGPVEIRAVIESGVMQLGTHFDYETPAIRVYAGTLVAGTQMHVAMAVAEHEGQLVSQAGVDLDRLHGGAAGKHDDRVTADKIEGFVAFGNTDLVATEWPLVDARLAIPRLHITELRDFAGVSEQIDPLGGAVDLSWTTSRADDGRFLHDGELELRNGAVRSSSILGQASASVRIGARTLRTWKETTIGKLQVDLDDVGLQTKNGESVGSWIHITGGHATLNHDNGNFDARVQGRLDDLRPILTHVSAKEILLEHIPDRDLTDPLRFDVGVQGRRGTLTLDIEDLSRPSLHVRGKVHRVGKNSRFAIVLGLAHIGIYGESKEKPSVDLAVGDDWLARKIEWVEDFGKR